PAAAEATPGMRACPCRLVRSLVETCDWVTAHARPVTSRYRRLSPLPQGDGCDERLACDRGISWRDPRLSTGRAGPDRAAAYAHRRDPQQRRRLDVHDNREL